MTHAMMFLALSMGLAGSPPATTQIAANNAVARIRGEKVQPKYSTD